MTLVQVESVAVEALSAGVPNLQVESVAVEALSAGAPKVQAESVYIQVLVVSINTLSGVASLTSGSTLTATAVQTLSGDTAMTEGSTLTAGATLARLGVVPMTADSTLTVVGTAVGQAVVGMTQGSTLGAAADLTRLAAVSMAEASTLTTTASTTISADAALSESSTLTTGANAFSGSGVDFTSGSALNVTGVVSVSGAAALSSGSTLSTTSALTVLAAVPLSAGSTLTTTATTTGILTGAVAMTSGSTLAAAATTTGTLTGDVAMTSGSTLVVAAGTATISGTFPFSFLAGIGVAYAGGGLGSPLALPASSFSVDFSTGVDTGDPAPVDGAATSVDIWYVFTSSSSSDWTFVWTGVGVGMEVWVYPGGIGVIDPTQMTLLASSATGTLSASLGQDVQYLLRVHPLSAADNAATGSIAYLAVGRAGSGTLQLQILTTVIDTPAWLQSSVTNATESGVLNFTLDGGATVIFSDTADLAGQLILSSILLEVLSVGAHTLTVTDVTSGQSATASFTVIDVVTSPTTAPVITPPTAVTSVRWQFYDPHPGGELYELPINPTKMSSPHSARVMVSDHTTDSLGQPIVFEGFAGATQWTWEGTVLAQGEYDAFERFFALQRRFWVIDHLMRAWLVTWESLEWEEVRDISNPVTARYRTKLLIYDDSEVIAP